MRTLLMTGAIAGLGVLGAGSPPPAAEKAEPHAMASSHWAYADQASWGGTCATGAAQSPVALTSPTNAADLPDLVTAYTAGTGTFVNNGHTLQFTPGAAGVTRIGAEEYNLVQFHFHAPSEHTLDGRAYPAELHFVNRNAAGQLAVVGVFIRAGAAANPALASLLAALPADDAHATTPAVHFATLLPASMRYFAYTGSLTTPPCSEGVRWNVLATPIEASAGQIAALVAAVGTSNRTVQPLNERALGFGE